MGEDGGFFSGYGFVWELWVSYVLKKAFIGELLGYSFFKGVVIDGRNQNHGWSI